MKRGGVLTFGGDLLWEPMEGILTVGGKDGGRQRGRGGGREGGGEGGGGGGGVGGVGGGVRQKSRTIT